MTIIRKAFRFALRIFKRLRNIIIGHIPISAQYQRHLLSTWYDQEKRSVIDNMLFPYIFDHWIKHEYLTEPDPDKREALKGLAMGKNSGRKWAQEYDNRPLDFNTKIGNMTLDEACPIYQEIENICKNTQDHMILIQVGSSSGREIAYFATRFPEFEHIGTDVYEEVVADAGQSHDHPNLSFKVTSAKDVAKLLLSHKGKKILIYSSGSLQYVQPEHMSEFFRSLAGYKNLRILISEPASESEGKPDEIKGSLWRGNFSYTHNYKYYAEASGLETEKCRIIRPYLPHKDFPGRIDTAHYFYSAKTELK